LPKDKQLSSFFTELFVEKRFIKLIPGTNVISIFIFAAYERQKARAFALFFKASLMFARKARRAYLSGAKGRLLARKHYTRLKEMSRDKHINHLLYVITN